MEHNRRKMSHGKRSSRGHNYKFTRKRHSKLGMSAFVIALCSIILCFATVDYSIQNQAMVSTYIGSAGLFFMLTALFSFGLALKSLRDKEKFKLYPILALAASILASGIWIGIYVLGFMII